jgi:hypothetical protein
MSHRGTLLLNHDRVQLTRLPFGIAIAVSLVVLFTPESGVPSAPPGTDKLVHFLLFAALMITGRIAGFTAVALLSGLVCYAAISEVLQSVLPLGRSGDITDALVDTAGIAIAGALFALWRRRRSP